MGPGGGADGGTLGSGMPAGAHYVPSETQQFVAGAALQSLRRTGQSSRHDGYFMAETLRGELHSRRAACMDMGNPNDPHTEAVSSVQVGQYHSWVPLDDNRQPKRNRPTLGMPSSLYKVIAESDGEAYALRRLEGPPTPDQALHQYGRMWVSMAHPNICRLVELFNSADEGQPCTYVVQQFYPNTLTLEQAFLVRRQPLTEDVLWSISLQVIAAIHCVHNAGLAVRVLDLSHVVLTGKDTVRLSLCGLLDVTRPDTTRPMAQQQHEDLLSLGRMLVCLACTSPAAADQQALQKSMGYIQASFSQEWSQLLMLCLSGGSPTIHDAVALTSGRMMTRMAQTQWYGDGLLNELSKECENGRLLRLLVKLSHASERQELGDDPGWGQSQDRHLLRLYRDSVFHVNDENGNAVLDFAQVVSSLNKLDVGHDGKTILTANSPDSRGELLLVSHKDIRDVLERSFAELVASQEQSQHMGEHS